MELLKSPYARGLRLGDVLYFGANLAFVGVLVLIIFVWQLPLLAFVLAILSKWRIFAVRPRYWGINLRSNLPDLIFITSTVGLAIHPLAESTAQLAWLALLGVWLIVIKPRSSGTMMLLQAGGSQFVAITALLSYAAFIPINQLYILVVVLGAWLAGYAAARHAITSYETEPKTEFFALLWGFIVAQLVWLFSHWLQVYAPRGLPGLEVPQIALILLLLAFCAQRAYALQRQIRDNEDPRVRKAATKRALNSTYVAAGFSASFIIIILLTTNWTITI